MDTEKTSAGSRESRSPWPPGLTRRDDGRLQGVERTSPGTREACSPWTTKRTPPRQRRGHRLGSREDTPGNEKPALPGSRERVERTSPGSRERASHLDTERSLPPGTRDRDLRRAHLRGHRRPVVSREDPSDLGSTVKQSAAWRAARASPGSCSSSFHVREKKREKEKES